MGRRAEHDERPGRRLSSAAAASLLLALLVLLADGRVLQAQFVSYDDEDYVLDNRHVAAGLTWRGASWAFGSIGYASNWHPLTWLSHMADVSLFGLRPWGHHLTSLLLHLGSALLLFHALRRVTGATWRSFLASALFGAHPLHVESVAWVAERKDVLAAFFWMLALSAWGRFARAPGPGRYVAAAACMACGLASKATVITLPVVLLILDWWPLARVAAGGSARGAGWWRSLGEKLPLLALSAAAGWITLVAQGRGGATETLALPFWARAANALVACAAYPLKALLPSGLAAFYPHPGTALPLWKPTVAGIALAAATWLAVRQSHRRPYLLFGWLWYLAALLPVAGLVQVGWQAMADRYTYLPLIGLFIAAAWGLGDRADALSPAGRRQLVAAVALWLAALSGASWVQAGYWRDTTTLFTHAEAVTGRNWMAEYTFGVAAWRQGRLAEAEARFREAIALNPASADTQNSLGAVLLKQGRAAEALPLLSRAVGLRPRDPLLHFNFGLALEGPEPQRAAAEYREALRLRPDFSEAAIRLAIAQQAAGAAIRRGR